MLFIIGGLSAAAFGWLNPILAAVLHNAGSLIVIFNSARLVRKGEELEHYQQEALGGDSGAGGSRHAAAGQLTPKAA